jgi:hypothetical protein
MTKRPDFRSYPPRGLSREDAARWIGASPSKFDQMRKDGRIGPAKLIDGRKVWDVRALNDAFDALPSEAGKADDDWNVGV